MHNEQRLALECMKSSAAFLDCVAGSGKTTMLTVIAMAFVMSTDEDLSLCVYAAPSAEMVDHFTNRLLSHVPNKDVVARLGFRGQDLFREHTQGVHNRRLAEQHDLLDAVDKCICVAETAARSSQNSPEKCVLVRLACWLLAL